MASTEGDPGIELLIHAYVVMVGAIEDFATRLKRFCAEYGNELNEEARSLEKASAWVATAVSALRVQFEAEADVSESDIWLSSVQATVRETAAEIFRESNSILGVKLGRLISRRVPRNVCRSRLLEVSGFVARSMTGLDNFIQEGHDAIARLLRSQGGNHED